MTDLIAKLEAATEGSRELDLEIHKALGWELAPVQAGVTWWATDGRVTFEGDMPHYTTSIDAARTSVPDGWWVSHAYWKEGEAMFNLSLKEGVWVEGRHAEPAHALTIAALKAREETGREQV